jgi:hypothetical protein
VILQRIKSLHCAASGFKKGLVLSSPGHAEKAIPSAKAIISIQPGKESRQIHPMDTVVVVFRPIPLRQWNVSHQPRRQPGITTSFPGIENATSGFLSPNGDVPRSGLDNVEQRKRVLAVLGDEWRTLHIGGQRIAKGQEESYAAVSSMSLHEPRPGGRGRSNAA